MIYDLKDVEMRYKNKTKHQEHVSMAQLAVHVEQTSFDISDALEPARRVPGHDFSGTILKTHLT
jgi:hypothetical protein